MSKKLLSITAAGILAAGLIGCGGGSGNSSSNSSSNNSKSVTGVDGYVMNANIQVSYLNPKTNNTETKTLTGDDLENSYYLVRDIRTGKSRAGHKEYSLADLNATVTNNLISISLISQGYGKLKDGSFHGPSFYDVDGNGEFNSSVDLQIPLNTTLTAPKGYSIITPISTLVAAKITALVKADPKNEKNITKLVDSYTAKVAAALGVDTTTLKNVDPLGLTNSKDPKAKAFVIANAFAGTLVANTNSNNLQTALTALTTAPKAQTAEDILNNLQTAATKIGKSNLANVLGQLKNMIKTNPNSLDSIVNQNLDKSRNQSKNGTLTLIGKKVEKKDFNLTKIDQIVETDPNGYKLSPAEMNDLNFSLVANDKNITNKKFKFVIKISNPKKANAGDENSTTLSIELPFEVNATNGVIDATVPSADIVKFEGITSGGTSVSKEINASALGIDGNTVLTLNNGQFSVKAKNLVEKIDNNASNEFFGGSYPSDIIQLKVGIESDNIAEVKADGDPYFVPTTNIKSNPGGLIVDSVLSMIDFDINKNLVIDSRISSGDRANVSPEYNANVKASTEDVYFNNNKLSLPSTQEVNGSTVMLAPTTSNSDANITLKFNKIDKDTFERNTKILATSTATGFVKAIKVLTPEVNHSIPGEANLTLDINESTSGYDDAAKNQEHPKYVFTYKAEDEFGKVGDERNVTVMLNLPPNNDLNFSKGISGFELKPFTSSSTANKLATDTNSSIKGHIIVNNGAYLDVNLTPSTNDSWEKLKSATFTLSDGNLTDNNLSVIESNVSKYNYQEFNASNAIHVTASNDDTNITPFLTYKVVDQFGASATNTAYFLINRAAYDLNDTNLSEYGADANATYTSGSLVDYNVTTVTLADHDAWTYDSSVAACPYNNNALQIMTSKDLKWTNTDDVNVTVDTTNNNNLIRLDLNGTGASKAEINVSFISTGVCGEYNMSIEYNDSNWTVNSSGGLDLNITGIELNATDKFGAKAIFDHNESIHLDAQ